MAQEQYGFFNSTVEDERSYDSADMAAMLRTLSCSGVADLGTCLRMTAEGSTMRTLAGYGAAMVEGHYFRLQDDGGGVKAFAHSTEAALNRIDRIILRLDVAARTVTLQKLIGTAASTPQPPALTRDAETWELSLAQVRIRAGAVEILPADITDERGDEAVCGLIAPDSLKRSVLVPLIGQMIDAAVTGIGAGYLDVLRYSAQSLEASQKTQSRVNIGAQAAISASGLLKGDGAGGVSAAAEGADYAGVSGGKVLADRISSTLWYYTGSHQLMIADKGACVLMGNASPAVVTIPNDATVNFPIGTEIEIASWNVGSIAITPASGVSLGSVDGKRNITKSYGVAALKKMDANAWLLSGCLS